MATDEEMELIYTSFCQRILDVEENPRTEFLSLEGYQNQPLVPISTAFQRLIGVGRSISNDLAVVKERISKVPTDNLNTEEAAAVYLYTMGKMSKNRPIYECLNNALRAKNQTATNLYFPFLKLFITALSKIDSVGQMVYRGAKIDLSEKYPIGKTFIWSGFSSCTTTGQMLWTEHFLGETGPRTFFKINCSNGKNIRQHSSLSTVDEIILLPGTKFKVIAKTSPSIDFHIIEIQEVASSNLFRQRLSSMSNEINPFSFMDQNSEQINIKTVSADKDSEDLLKKIEEQRDKREGEFSSFNVNDEQVVLIANEIKTNTSWKMLKLTDNKINNDGMVHLSPALVLNSTLEALFLDYNYVGDYATRLLTDALLRNFTLVNLTLSGNVIEDLGAKSLAELLRTNSTLTDLSLSRNIIGNNGMIALCETLEQYNRTLKKFRIDNNNISDKSVEAIVAFRTMNHVLNDFKYDGNRFSQQALDTLQAANKKHEEILKSLSCVNEVAVVYLEIKHIPEKQLSRDASYLFTNFRRLLSAEIFEQFTKIHTNRTIYLILCCEDDLTIRVISSFCSKRKILLYILQTRNQNIDKNTNIFSCEETMIFRLTTRIGTHYRCIGEQAIRMGEKEKARNYFEQGIDMHKKLVTYLKKRQRNPVVNQNNTCGILRNSQFPDAQTTKSLISTIEN